MTPPATTAVVSRPETIAIPRKAADWITRTDTGASSIAIWRHMIGLPTVGSWFDQFTPNDAEDFGRCHHLLEVVPEWRPRIVEMARYRGWHPIVAIWRTIEQHYTDGQWARVRELLHRVEPRAR